MRLDDFEKTMVAKDIALDKVTEVTFLNIQYRTNDEGDVTGAFIHIKDYKSLYIPIFEERNTQLDAFLEQLGCDSRATTEINKHRGAKIKASRYQVKRNDRTYTNVSFTGESSSTTDTFA